MTATRSRTRPNEAPAVPAAPTSTRPVGWTLVSTRKRVILILSAKAAEQQMPVVCVEYPNSRTRVSRRRARTHNSHWALPQRNTSPANPFSRKYNRSPLSLRAHVSVRQSASLCPVSSAPTPTTSSPRFLLLLLPKRIIHRSHGYTGTQHDVHARHREQIHPAAKSVVTFCGGRVHLDPRFLTVARNNVDYVGPFLLVSATQRENLLDLHFVGPARPRRP